MTQDAAFDDAPDSRPVARVKSSMGAVLGIIVALLIAVLPGGSAITQSRLQSAFSAATPDQSILASVSRFGEARFGTYKARGPNTGRPEFGDTPALLVDALILALFAAAAFAPRAAFASVRRPTRWPSTARARAPPRN